MGELRNIIISIILVSLTFTALLAFYADLYTTYNVNPERYSNESYSYLNESEDLIDSLAEDLVSSENLEETAEDSLFKNAFKLARTYISNSFKIAKNMIWKVSSVLGVPSYWVFGFISIILIIIIFALISGVLKNKW